MEHNTDRILWTVLVLAIGVALYVGFRPAANGLLHQVVDKTQAVMTNVHGNTSDSSSTNTAIGANLIKGTSSDFQTAPDTFITSSGNNWGGVIHTFSSDELTSLAGGKVTARVFIHNPTTHTVNLELWTDRGRLGIGTGVPAGTDGYSTITAYNPSNATSGDISIRDYTDNVAISSVQYKELKIEKGSVATPY